MKRPLRRKEGSMIDMCHYCGVAAGESHLPGCQRSKAPYEPGAGRIDWATKPHPESCSCDDCVRMRREDRPRFLKRRTRRRVHGDYEARKFWETCVIAGIAAARDPHRPLCASLDIVTEADSALVAWRERWEKPAEVHSPDYVPPEEEGGNDHQTEIWRSCEGPREPKEPKS